MRRNKHETLWKSSSVSINQHGTFVSKVLLKVKVGIISFTQERVQIFCNTDIKV